MNTTTNNRVNINQKSSERYCYRCLGRFDDKNNHIFTDVLVYDSHMKLGLHFVYIYNVQLKTTTKKKKTKIPIIKKNMYILCQVLNFELIVENIVFTTSCSNKF